MFAYFDCRVHLEMHFGKCGQMVTFFVFFPEAARSILLGKLYDCYLSLPLDRVSHSSEVF